MPRPLRHLDDLSPEDSVYLENCISRFEAAWQRGERPALDDYLTGDGPPRRVQLLELVHTDLEYRLKAGEPARVEDYLRRYPELAADRNVVLDLFAAEFERRCGSPRPCAGQAQPQFPESGDERITVVLAGQASTGREVPPREKERRLGRYVLLEEIGSGSFGTVHKAFDTELRRMVALKVPQRGGLTDARFLREARGAAASRHRRGPRCRPGRGHLVFGQRTRRWTDAGRALARRPALLSPERRMAGRSRRRAGPRAPARRDPPRY